MSNLVSCATVFILFYRRRLQERVFKVIMNDHYFSIFSSSGLYPQDFWQVKEWLIVELRDERATCSCVLNGFYEFALCRSALWSAKTYGK